MFTKVLFYLRLGGGLATLRALRGKDAPGAGPVGEGFFPNLEASGSKSSEAALFLP